MNIFMPNFYLVLYILTNVAADEVATKIDPLTTTNYAKLSDTGTRDPKLDKATNDQTSKEHAKTVTPTKFNMKDFKVTTLKSNHNEDTEVCLTTADSAKVEAVRKTLKSVDGKIHYAKPLNEEEKAIAECLKKEYNSIKTRGSKNVNATESNLDTVEEVDMMLQGKAIKGRRDTEYQFDPLEYYDETITFDPSTCPDDVDVIDLEISELKHYDVECELLTFWLGLSETLVGG